MIDGAPLESVIVTDRLASRAVRAGDSAAERAAILELVDELGSPSQHVLQRATDLAVRLTGAGSAGVAVFEREGSKGRFRWYAVSGALRHLLWEVSPGDASPSALTMARGEPMLFRFPERHFRYLAEVRPQLVEVLHLPFRAGDETIGSIWIAMHDEARGFDAADLEVLETVARVAGAGYALHRRMETLRDANRRKDEFLGVLSHEIRNPLAAMNNALRFLNQEDDGTPEQQRARALLARQLGHVTRLSEDLLDVARLGEGTLELRREPADLLHAVRMAREAAQPALIEYGRGVDMDLPDGALIAEGDPARLTQIVTNLITNAARRTRAGALTHLVAHRDGGEARIVVWGEADDVASAWTEHDAAAHGSGNGRGVGIELARSLTELHGGKAAVVDVGGFRANGFEVRFPLVDAGSRLPAPVRRLPAADRPRLRRERVLIIDDCVDSSDSLAMLLQSWGHDVRSAQGASAGLGLEWEFEPDAVILDIEMPGKNGYEVAAELRVRRRRELLLVALSGYAREEDRAKSLAAGFDHHLTKPANVEMLRRLLA